MRRMALCLILLGWLLSACSGSSRSFVWQEINTELDVRADGRLGVTETLTLRYTGGPFTFVARDLPERRLDAITNISVADADQVYEQVDDPDSEQPYTFSAERDGDTLRVRWVYPDTVDGQRTFVLRYEVIGAVRRYDDADELWWSMVFADRDELVERATGRVTLPEPVSPAQLDVTTPDVAGTVELAPGLALVQASNIPPDEELSLRVRFPNNVVGGIAPLWQAEQVAQEQYNATTRPAVNTALSLATAAVAALLGALLWAWWRRSRDPAPRGFAGGELVAAPDDLAPALAAKLVGSPDTQAFLATLFDLANRGHVTFREQMGGWRNQIRQVVLARASGGSPDLATHEAAALDALFEKGDEVVLDDSSSVAAVMMKVGALAQQSLVEQGLLSAAGLAGRKRATTIGALLAIFGGIGLVPSFILAERYSWWLPALAGAVVLMGLAWLIVAASVRGLTQVGADAQARWFAFQRYLKRLGPGVAPGGQFSQLLPYAVAIADASRLTSSYAATSEPLPTWYFPVVGGHSSSGSGDAGASGTLLLQDFSQNFLSSLSSASSGASGGSGGGGGASGGGGGSAG